MHAHVTLLWVCLGHNYLRAHQGSIWFYNKVLGSFEPYNGILPDYLHAELRQILLQIEGLFRSFDGDVPRTQEGILRAIAQTYQKHSAADPFSSKKILAELVANAVFNKGDAKLKQAKTKGKGKDKGEPAPDDLGEDTSSMKHLWYILTAQHFCKMGTHLMAELIGNKLLSVFSEWCAESF